MKLPCILSIYESPQCEGILSPFIVKTEIEELIELITEKQKNLLQTLNCIPDMKVIRGGQPHHNKPTHKIGQSSIKNNLKFVDRACDTGVIDKDAVILPPHKVTYNSNENCVHFESNIYHPCLKPYDHNPSSAQINENQKVYKTGNYPKDVNTYSSLDEIKCLASNYIEEPCHCNHNDHIDLLENKDELQEELCCSWIKNIQQLQIHNLITALVSSNKINLNPPLIKSFRVVISTILEHNLITTVSKIGIMYARVRTISAPHAKYVSQLFVEVHSEHVRDEINTILSEALRPFSRDISVLIFTNAEFDLAKRQYPVPVCFECRDDYLVKEDIPVWEMVLVNENQFIANVSITFDLPCDNSIQLMGAAQDSIISVKAESSGTISFILGDNETKTSYTINKVMINKHHVYSLEELLEGTASEYEYSNLSAELVTMDHPNFYKIFKLFYKNLKSDIKISILPIMILPSSEFSVDKDSITYRISRMLPMTFHHTTTGALIPTPYKSIVLNVLFTKSIDRFVTDGVASAYIIKRSFNSDTNKWDVSEELRDDIIMSLSSVNKNSLIKQRQFTININNISELTEYCIKILPETLHTYYVDNGVRREALNADELYIHFVVNPITEEVEILDKDELPSYILNTPSELKAQCTVEILDVDDIAIGKAGLDNMDLEGNDSDQSYLTDNDPNTYWRSAEMIGDNVDPQWFVIDLVNSSIVRNIELAFEAKGWPTEYKIQTSDNLFESPDWTDIAEIKRTDGDESDLVDCFDMENNSCGMLIKRYLRVYFTKMNQRATMLRRISVRGIKIMGAELPQDDIQTQLINSSLSLSHSHLVMLVGNQVKLTCTLDVDGSTIIPESVNYESANPEVVAVDDEGNLTAIARGFTTITATVQG